MTTFNADDLNDVNDVDVTDVAYEQLPDPTDDDLDDEPDGRGPVTPELIAKVAQSDEDIQPPDVIPGTTVALADRFDAVLAGENWRHDWLEFKGDKLGIRLPTRQALAAFSLMSGRYVDLQMKNDLTSLFIARHMSPESFARVFSRLMDPDEETYTVDTVGEMFNAIVTASLKADDKPR